MKRIAAPMIGSIFTSFVLKRVVYPAIYAICKWHLEVKKIGRGPYLIKGIRDDIWPGRFNHRRKTASDQFYQYFQRASLNYRY